MAGNLQAVGTAALVPGPLRISAGPKGTTSHYTVTCTEIGPLIAHYNYMVQFGATVECFGFDLGIDTVTTAFEKRLEVSFPGLISSVGLNLNGLISELFFDSWELMSNESSDTIFDNPLIVGTAAGGSGWMNANDKDVLSQLAIAGGTVAGAVANADANVPANAPHSIPTDVRSLQLIMEILKGQTEYEKPTYVLRHTSYCSAGQTYNSSVAYTQCIYTPAQLLSEVGSGWTYNLPTRLYSKIASIPFQYAPADESAYYRWGWLKKITREPVLANFMVEVSTEYELGLWSNLRYALR